MVDVARQAEARGDVEIGADAEQHRAGIGEVRLALLLGRAQRVQDAVAAVDRDRAAAAGEGDGLADPIAGVGAGEDRILENGVEAALDIVIGIAVAAGEQRRAAQSDPVEVDRRLGGGEEALDARGFSGEDVVAVRSEQAVDGGGEVDAADPPVGIVAQIDDVVIAGAQVAEQGRAHRKAVVIDLDLAALAVDVPGEARLAGQADEREILAEKVGVQDPVVARALEQVVKARIGVLLQPPGGDQVILEAVVVAVAEQADAELLVLEQEAAESRTGRAGCRPGRCRSRSGRRRS